MLSIFITSIFLFTTLFPILLQAQEIPSTPAVSKQFLNISAGPSFAASQRLDYVEHDRNDGTRYYQAHKFGYAKGASFLVSYGYMVHPNIGLEIGIGKLIGASSNWKNVYYKENNGNPYIINDDNSMKASLWKFQSSANFKVNFRKISPYLKVGFLLSTGNNTKRDIIENVTYFNNTKGYKGDYQVTNTGGSGLGILASFGLDIKASPNDFFFFEINYTSLNHQFKKWEQTKYTINGNDLLSKLTPAEKSGKYSDLQTDNTFSNLSWSAPLSSVSILAGIRIALDPRNKVDAK